MLTPVTIVFDVLLVPGLAGTAPPRPHMRSDVAVKMATLEGEAIMVIELARSDLDEYKRVCDL